MVNTNSFVMKKRKFSFFFYFFNSVDRSHGPPKTCISCYSGKQLSYKE